MEAKDLRNDARDALRGKWGLAVITGFIAALLGGTTNSFNTGGSGYVGNNGGWNTVVSSISDELFSVLITIGLVLVVLCVVWFIIGSTVEVGYAGFNLRLVRRQDASIKNIFSCFDRWGRIFLMGLLRSIYLILWTCLLIVPGIIKSYSYAMAPYIMHDNPDVGAGEAIRRSKEMMDGYKWHLFCLRFSFIGWLLLAALTCGIGYLWIGPYINAAEAAFYEKLCSVNT
ncbi:MAG: DUF975 family protein [Candidatus Ornithomonoglobus sp.]